MFLFIKNASGGYSTVYPNRENTFIHVPLDLSLLIRCPVDIATLQLAALQSETVVTHGLSAANSGRITCVSFDISSSPDQPVIIMCIACTVHCAAILIVV